MQIRIRSTGQVMYDGEFRALHSNVSMPQQLTAELLDGYGADVVFEGAQASPTRYQTSFADGVELVGVKWFTKYSVADMDAEAITALDAQQAQSVRDDRNKRLAETDWTQLTDAPVDTEAWATYRTNLRNVTAQETFPWDITWPTKPTE